MTETAAIAGLSSNLLPGLSSSQKSIFKLNIPTKNIPNPIEPSFFNFNLPGFGESKKSKRRKKKGSLYAEGAFERSDIVANSVSKQIANILNNAIGKVE